MAKTIELLLLNNVENLGIVGDLVKVKPGYARNYLLPMQLAEFPTEEKIESLKEARAVALKELEALKAKRQSLIEQLEDIEVTLVRSANDQGALYGSVTQRDIADALSAAGYDVELRAIRLSSPIRRVGSYTAPIQFGRDQKTEITVIVESDQPIEELDEPDEPQVEGEAAEGAEASAEETPATADA